MSKAKYLFLDLETTGLDPRRESILECAALVVTADLRILDDTDRVLHFDRSVEREPIDPFVIDMHTVNGLWLDCEHSADEVDLVACTLEGMIAAHDWEEGKPILAGASIHFDRSFLQTHMPSIVERLHHRMLDVSSLKLLRKDAGAPDMPKVDVHRAMPDALHSLAEARQIRDEMAEGCGWT
jgi:oligoribonuclease